MAPDLVLGRSPAGCLNTDTTPFGHYLAMHKLSQEDARHVRRTYYEHGPMAKRSARPHPRTVECIAFMRFVLKFHSAQSLLRAKHQNPESIKSVAKFHVITHMPDI